jgi:hypothetical protein
LAALRVHEHEVELSPSDDYGRTMEFVTQNLAALA